MRPAILLLFFFGGLLSSEAQEKGKASYYNSRFHNKKTASGIVYHKDSLYAAHKKHSFGTLLRVKNLKNEKEVIVKVIDRGPYARGRVIDLSLAAAKKIGMIQAGIANVELEVVKDTITQIDVSID